MTVYKNLSVELLAETRLPVATAQLARFSMSRTKANGTNLSHQCQAASLPPFDGGSSCASMRPLHLHILCGRWTGWGQSSNAAGC